MDGWMDGWTSRDDQNSWVFDGWSLLYFASIDSRFDREWVGMPFRATASGSKGLAWWSQVANEGHNTRTMEKKKRSNLIPLSSHQLSFNKVLLPIDFTIRPFFLSLSLTITATTSTTIEPDTLEI